MNVIEAKEGYTFKRIHDGFVMGDKIYLGVDFSTGEPREDLPEYYEEIEKTKEELEMESRMFGGQTEEPVEE